MSKVLEDHIPEEFQKPTEAFSSAMHSMVLFWWYWDVSSLHLQISPELMKLLGNSDSITDDSEPPLDKFIHQEDKSDNRNLFNKLLKDEIGVYESEFRLNLNGNWTWYYSRGTVIARDTEGKALFVAGIMMDISSRYKRILAQLEEGHKFEFIFKNTKEAVLIVRIGDGQTPPKILEVNNAATELFACREEDLIGYNPYNLMNIKSLERRENFRKQLMTKGFLKLNMQAQDFKGKLKFLEIHAHLFNETGENLFIALLTDKTESHLFKEELKASESALRQSETIYKTLIEAADDRIGLFEVGGKVVFINNAFSETLGFSHEEFLALEDQERIHPDDKARLEQMSVKLFETGYLFIDYRARHKEGHYLNMSSKSVLVKDPEFDKDYVLLIIRDITDKIDFQKELFMAKERAIESDKLKSAFLANMSHEIRTPMNSIVGFSNLLVEEDIDENSKKEYIRRINRNSSQLLALISDIIDLAKIESNQLSVSFTKVILNNLFYDLENYGKIQLEQHERTNVTFTYKKEGANSDLVIESDLVRLTQILQNLINNAVKFTSEGEIEIGYIKEDDGKVCLFVKDTGTGIERKNFKLIFDQFRQIDGSNVRKYAGTGLGLAICKNLVGLLNGKIWLESEKGKGSTFYVELPIKSGFVVEDQRKVIDSENLPVEKLTVLAVDDDPDTLMLLVTILRNEDIQTITANSAYKALEILEREGLPDIILMDLQMPVINGIQVLKIIRELYPDQKIIAQSAHALEGEKDKSLIAGFDDYISKPYSKHALLEVIKGVLKK